MEQTTTSTESQTYQIGGRTFTVRPVVARQEKWLWPLMKPLFQKGESITVEDIFAVMGDSITRMAAILLLAEGQTQPEKVRAGLAGVDQLEAWLDETVSVSELGPVIADFFASGQQWKLFTGLAGPLHLSATGPRFVSASHSTPRKSERHCITPSTAQRPIPARQPRPVARAVMVRPGSARSPECRTWSGWIPNIWSRRQTPIRKISASTT